MLLLPAMVLAQTSMQGKVTDASTGVTAPGATGYARQLGRTSSSARLQAGVKAGLNLATYTGKLLQGAKFRPTLTLGGFVTYYFTKNFAIQPEANFMFAGSNGTLSLYHYVTTGYSKTQYTYKSIKTAYVQIPLLFKYAFSNSGGIRPAVFAGPAIDINLGSQFDPVGTSLYSTPQVIGEGSSIVAGLSAKAGKILLDARFNYGLNHAFNVMDATNTEVAITIGYIF
jgi:hypothetical protein